MVKIVILAFLFGVLGSAGYNYFFYPKFANVDIFSLVQDEQKNIVELVKTGKLQDKEVEERVKNYLGRVENALMEVSKEDKLVILQKGILLSPSEDVTEKVKKKLESSKKK